MVLKVTGKLGGDWKFFGGVKSVEVLNSPGGGVYLYDTFEHIALRYWQIVPDESSELIREGDDKLPFKLKTDGKSNLIVIHVDYGDGKKTMMLTDSPTYLMSEEGKTIERLN